MSIIKGNTRSLDYSSHDAAEVLRHHDVYLCASSQDVWAASAGIRVLSDSRHTIYCFPVLLHSYSCC